MSNKTVKNSLAFASILLAGLAFAETEPPQAAPVASPSPAAEAAATTAPAVSVPPLEFQHETLPNGLEVYFVEDHSSPTVAVQVWYQVGSKDDPEQRSGFAHLFEHMMFKGNERLTPDAFDNLTENIGGENNAYTAPDVTVYFEVVPSNYLNPILWAEAERMSSLALTEANFKSERDVVKEEYRQRILANPYGEFFLDTVKNSYAVIPTSGRGSATSRNWMLPSCQMRALFTPPFIGRTTHRPTRWPASRYLASPGGTTPPSGHATEPVLQEGESVRRRSTQYGR